MRSVNRAPLPLPMKAVLAFISLLSIASCRTVVSPNAVQQLAGDWRYVDQIQSCHYSFKSDGSFTGEVKHRAKLVSKFTGRWWVTHQAIHYRYLTDALGSIPPGATDRDQLLEVKKDSFVIQAANGERRRYVRIP
jgi:hypothetical protein